jgi:hypothetical protein
MNKNELLSALGKNIFNRIIDDTNPGDEFLLSIIDPDTFDKLKEETGDRQQVENALKSTGRMYSIPDDYIAISVAVLQVSLIYSETNITDDSFYSRITGGTDAKAMKYAHKDLGSTPQAGKERGLNRGKPK